MRKETPKGKKKKAEKSYSGIDAHKREKKSLIPPLMAIPGVVLQSWVNERLPEMLWAALLISRLGREHALERFRTAAALVPNLPIKERMIEPTLSGLASLDGKILRRFLSVVCTDSESKNALRPLLLLDELPAKQVWAITIGLTPVPEDWESLKMAVLAVLDHQSQEATDCRWLRVLFHVLSGKFHLPTKEHVREILNYPAFGLQQKVRPTIRSMEGILDQFSKSASNWPASFWKQCLRDTPCDARHTLEAESLPLIATTGRRLREVREALARHERACLDTTGVDAKHDATFGFGGYALAILDELISAGNSTAIIGRIGLRTLLECYVTFLHLKCRDDSVLWMAYRQYGSGQAKLAFLKLTNASATAVPSYINPEILQQLANEDRWLEFVSIDLGHWAATDLRKLSEDSGVKPDYDRLYPWTSAFTHGNWAAVRNSCFDLCINPLHRLHRRLRSNTADLGDVVPEACELVDKILDTVDSLYPGFTQRVTLPESRTAVTNVGVAAQGASAPKLAPLVAVQREFFEILDEFFRRATGSSAGEFAQMDSFGDRVRAEAHNISSRAGQALMFAHETLASFYKRFGSHLNSEAKALSGVKLVFGGSSQLHRSQLKAVSKMLLYADSILIPDPILPWIESPRVEEGLRTVRFLEAVFYLLHFRPLAEVDLPCPPILTFPSFEKSLEERDPTTQSRMGMFITRVLSHFLGRQFETPEELQRFVTTNEADFMQEVDEKNLFVAPGGHVGQPLHEALAQYEAEIKQWRSQSYQRTIAKMPKGALLLNGLFERLAPHYHLLENAEELSACPLIALNAHWHYYSLISKFFAARVQAHGSLNTQALAALDLVNTTPPNWLGDVPLAHLVELLSNGENQRFRVRLNDLVNELRIAPRSNLNMIVPKVCGGIASLIQESEHEIIAIQERYKPRYGEKAVVAYLTKGATYLPTLAPTVRIQDHEHEQRSEHPETTAKQNESAHSLLGVFAFIDES
jgi:Family of unknown function (DUF5677)